MKEDWERICSLRILWNPLKSSKKSKTMPYNTPENLRFVGVLSFCDLPRWPEGRALTLTRAQVSVIVRYLGEP